MSFPSSAACKFLDLPPVSLRNLHLHRTKNPFAGRPPHLCGVALKKRGEGERVERKYLLLGECDAKREVCALCEAICPLEDKEPSDDRRDFSSRQGHRRAQFVPAVRTIRPDGKNHTETGGRALGPPAPRVGIGGYSSWSWARRAARARERRDLTVPAGTRSMRAISFMA